MRLGGIAEVAGNAAIAVVEVSKAVSMRGVEAPDVATKSYVALGKGGGDGAVAIDEEGLPLVYDKAAIQVYWDNQGGALQKRWGEFLGLSVPFLTRVATMSITGGGARGRTVCSQCTTVCSHCTCTHSRRGRTVCAYCRV